MQEHIVSFDIGELITRKLQHDTKYREACITKSEEWKRGEHWQETPTGQLDNFDDAAHARFHPHLMRPATSEERKDLRVGLIVNADDVEVVNPLGCARGDHKECGVQCATANLDTEDRMAPENIMLPALAKAKLYKVHGMARVIAGVDQDGVMHDEPNLAADLRALADGKLIKIPDDSGLSDSGFLTVRLVVYVVLFSGDYLGAQSMLPFSECPNSHVFCRGCDYDSRTEAAGRPFSFLRKPRPMGSKASTAEAPFCERDWPTLKAAIDQLRAGYNR